MLVPTSDIAFTPTIKAIQTARGSRAAYAKVEARGGFRTAITDDLVEFLAGVDTAYLATANAQGQPYANTAADRKASSAWSTSTPSALPISPATGNTFPPAISPKMIARFSF